MTSVVVDVSALGLVLLPDERSGMSALITSVLYESTIYVPPHWSCELANMILLAWRRKRLTSDERAQACTIADELIAGAIITPLIAQSSLIEFALHHELTTYDAAYVQLAYRLGAPLLTNDGPMKRAAIGLGINLTVQ